MLRTLIPVWPLFFGLGMIMIGNGLQGTLLGVRASIEGFPTWLVGVVMSGYYIGFLCGSVVVPKFLAQVGHIRVFAAMASLASSTVLLHGVFLDPMAWLPVRVLTGFSYAGLYIVAESWLNGSATNKTRGQIMAVYLLITYVGLSVGQFLLNVADPAKLELFVLTSILVSLALVPISLANRPAPEFSEPETTSVKKLYKTSPLGLTSVIHSGFAMGVIFAIAPVFAMASGMTGGQIAGFMAAMIIGGVVFQIPVGWLSDRMDRRILIIVNAAVAAALCFLCASMVDTYNAMLLLVLALFGGASMTIYGLGLAHTNDHVDPNKIVATSATMILMNGAGACLGPIIVTTMMQVLGEETFFPFVGATYFAVAVYGTLRICVRGSIPVEEQGDFVAMPARSSTIVPQIVEEDEVPQKKG